MSRPIKRNLAASVRQRLLTLSQDRKEPFDTVLARYAIERLLYRLSTSSHADRFVLKGAMLFVVWAEAVPRPTRDLNLLGYGSPDPDEITRIFREICASVVEPDGLNFLQDTVSAESIRDNAAYPGIRVKIIARLANIRIPVQVDIGFGDAITPHPERADFPTLLDFPGPRLRAYPIYTVIAEKIEAMASLGLANSRMKDFYDLWFMSQNFDFKGSLVVNAIRNTFECRKTNLTTELPSTEDFTRSVSTNWHGFTARNKLTAPHIEHTLVLIRLFVDPPLSAARKDEKFNKNWKAGGTWQ